MQRHAEFAEQSQGGEGKAMIEVYRRELGYSREEAEKLAEVCECAVGSFPDFPGSEEYQRRKLIYVAMDGFKRIRESCLPELFQFAQSENKTEGLRTKEHYQGDPVKRDAWGSLGEAKEKFYEAVRLIENGCSTAEDAIHLFQCAELRCSELVAEFKKTPEGDAGKRAERYKKRVKGTQIRSEKATTANKGRAKLHLDTEEGQEEVLKVVRDVFSGKVKIVEGRIITGATMAEVYRELAKLHGIRRYNKTAIESSIKKAVEKRMPKGRSGERLTDEEKYRTIARAAFETLGRLENPPKK